MEIQEDILITTESAFHSLQVTDADDMVARAELMKTIGRIIKQRQLTQAEIGTLIGMDQPRISALMRGRITLFSTDRLLKALSDLGFDVEMRVVAAKSGKGKIHVLAA